MFFTFIKGVGKIIFFVLVTFFIITPTIFVYGNNDNTIYFFYGTGCPHCAVVEKYFEENNIKETYSVVYKEIYFNKENAKLYNTLLNDLKYPVSKRGVPLIVMGETVLVGDRLIIENFKTSADNFIGDYNKAQADYKDSQNSFDLTLPLVVGASIVDAINPCAFAVLIILMSTILISGNSKNALYSGVAFSISIFISYFLMGLGLYSALSVTELSTSFFSVIGWLAIIIGLLNIKDYLWYGKGFLMEVPISWRPHLKRIISSVTNPIGAFFVGFLVSLFLLPCTSGPYIIILGMLSSSTQFYKAVMYLIIYNLIFILPMLIITYAVYTGFSPSKAEMIRQKRLKTLHLYAGIIMIVMGVVILSGWVS